MPLLNATGRTAISPADLEAFDAPPRPELLNGPARIHRFGDKRGRWWYAKALLAEMKEDYLDASLSDARLHASELTMHLRYGLAVSREWNKFQWISTITLDASEDLEAWVGRTAPQPEWTTLPDGRILHGGLVQYLIYDLSKAPEKIFSQQSLVSLCRAWSKTISGVRVSK